MDASAPMPDLAVAGRIPVPARSIACLDAEVLRVEDLTPSFRRFTFGGAGLDRFGIDGPPRDLRIKLLIPAHSPERLRRGQARRFDVPAFLAQQEAAGVSWYPAWLQIDPSERGWMRTFTVRAWREDVRELDVDVVLHTPADAEPAGPAERWARDARVGDRLHLLGPDRDAPGPTGGIEFRPDATGDLLLVGDETAVPAIASILASLPPHARGRALLEVPLAADADAEALTLSAPAGVEVTWLPREGRAQGVLLDAAVRELLRPGAGAAADAPLEEVDIDTTILWETGARDDAAPEADAAEAALPGVGPASAPAGHGPEFSAWIAGEAGAVTGIRRYLVREVGVDRRRVAFMGYWRIGRAES